MKEKADLIVRNAVIHCTDDHNRIAGAMAVRDGRVLATGSGEEIAAKFGADRVVDMEGRHVYPGFIDAHCHFYGYAIGLQYIDLTGSRSFDEVLARLREGGQPASGKWLVGRGWDQNLWPVKEFPDNHRLDEIWPGVPVMLIRIDGHVVLASSEALRRAGISSGHKFDPAQVQEKEGRLTGILSETAADVMRNAVPEPEGGELESLLARAERNCLDAGLTMVADAGLDLHQLENVRRMQHAGGLHMHIYAMLTPTVETLNAFLPSGPMLENKLTVRSVKIYADGSLGSRTARLKKPYADDPSTSGIMVTLPDSIISLCKVAYEKGYQVNTHCIGDSATHLVLSIYAGFLKGKNDLRWRIEHAQVVDPPDMHLFGDYSVVPSVQATHATSDMRWAADRLGEERMAGAYAYRSLLQQNGWIPNGTDFPIEHISPLKTFFAAVARKDESGYPEGGFGPGEALTREEALKSITIWAARSCFTEKSKGSLEPGKDADFVVLDGDLMTVPEMKIPGIRVTGTWIAGEQR